MRLTRKQIGRVPGPRSKRVALICAAMALGTLVQAVPAMANPGALSPPELSRNGRTLSTTNGTWLLPATYSYGWQRCDGGGADCVGVSGRTGPTYLLTTPDIGKRIRSFVVAAGGLGGPGTAFSALTAPIAAAPPVNTVPPTATISGSSLSSTLGIWSDPSPGSVVYGRRWQRCSGGGGLDCQDLAGAVGITYAATSGDVGKFLRVVVSAEGLGKMLVASAPIGPIVAPPGPGGGGGGSGGGGGGGGGSTPIDGLRKMRPFPRVIIAGRLARGRTFISGLSIRRGPKGATVSVRCRGRGCPRGRFRKKLGRSGSMRLKRYRRIFGPGAIIEIRVTKAGSIGKYTRLTVRRRSVPSRRDSCLKPGSSKPTRCP